MLLHRVALVDQVVVGRAVLHRQVRLVGRVVLHRQVRLVVQTAHHRAEEARLATRVDQHLIAPLAPIDLYRVAVPQTLSYVNLVVTMYESYLKVMAWKQLAPIAYLRYWRILNESNRFLGA